ncbi:hypothetical protein HD554DRAFT_2053152 [Boletus coccyginus]|nr:hypothetical protein HD554DRAFT_2053152 [Boletus coccyginus]
MYCFHFYSVQRGVDPEVATMNFNCLPVELHHQVLSFMDPEDILALRKTSKYFLALTHESRLWTSVYDRMRQTHPLSYSQSEFAALSSCKSERLLVGASKTEKLLQTFREHAQHRIFKFPAGRTRKTISRLAALFFVSERFLLSVDDTTAVYVWDMSELGASVAEAPALPCARLALARWRFVTYSMTIDHSVLYVILERGTRAQIFNLSLPSGWTTSSDTDKPKLSFRDVAYFYTHGGHVMSINADSCLVLMEFYGSTIEVVNWQTESRSTIHLHQETTGVVSIVAWFWVVVSYCTLLPSHSAIASSPCASVDLTSYVSSVSLSMPIPSPSNS